MGTVITVFSYSAAASPLPSLLLHTHTHFGASVWRDNPVFIGAIWLLMVCIVCVLPAVLCVCAIAQNCPSGSTSLDRMLPSLSGGARVLTLCHRKLGKHMKCFVWLQRRMPGVYLCVKQMKGQSGRLLCMFTLQKIILLFLSGAVSS